MRRRSRAHDGCELDVRDAFNQLAIFLAAHRQVKVAIGLSLRSKT